MFLSLPNLVLTALIQLLLLPSIQSCPYLTSLDSLPGGQLAIMALIIMTIASYREFLLQAHQVQRFLHTIKDVLQSYLQKAFRQLSRLSRHFSMVNFQLMLTIHWLFTIPVKLISRTDGCISNTRPNLGLVEPTSFVMISLEPLWQKYCDLISRGDFWALIGKLSVEKVDPTGTMNIPYYYGRVDKTLRILFPIH